VLFTAELPGPPSTLQLFYNDGGEHGDEVLYGTTDGKIGLIQLSRYFLGKMSVTLNTILKQIVMMCMKPISVQGW
jgi:hypothetical protein